MDEKSGLPNQPKKETYFWIVLIILGIVLFATNPKESQFKEFLKQDLRSEAAKEDFITQLLAGPTATLAGLTTERTDYVVFSMYEISILGDRYTYAGALNHFFRIK